MSLSVALVLVIVGVLLIVLVNKRRKGDAHAASETSLALESWLPGALEAELAGHVLETLGSVAEERKRLGRTLRGEPDPELVSKIEDKVRSIAIEYVRYAHETDVEVTLRVGYENGETGTAQKRLAWNDVPEAVRNEFEKKSTTRVFRPWDFPWARAS